MHTYLLRFERTVIFESVVEAESESAARQAWIDGDYDDMSLVEIPDDHDDHLLGVKEIR